MKCTNCGFDIVKDVKFCPKCGAKAPVAFNPNTEGNVVSHDISGVWPEWKLIKQLGRGSFGVVYEAVRNDNNVECRAAIKIISIPSDRSEIDSMRSEGLDEAGTKTFFRGIVNDFVSEIRLMESLKGIQNIVSVEDYKVVEKTDSIGWDIYIRMELLTPFNTHLQAKALTEAQVIKLGCDLCAALDLCAKKNIIHRDIKPENIFVNDFGHYKLGDFGIARTLDNATGGLSQKGTFNYMAPEIATGTHYDARADIYSLGIVLYRLLNENRLPFLDNEQQVLSPNERRQAVERRIHGDTLPAPKNASKEMADVILRACSHDPNGRFATAAEMSAALAAVAAGTYVLSSDSMDKTTAVRAAAKSAPAVDTTTIPTFDEPKKKKNKSLIIGAVVAGIVIVIGCIAAIALFAGSSDDSKQTSTKSSGESTEVNVIEGIIAEADSLVASGDYTKAIETIDTALTDHPDSDELKGKREEYVTSHIDSMISDAEPDFNNNEFASAIEKIESALETYPDNEKLLEKQEYYDRAYIDSFLSAAEEYANSGSYADAVAEIDRGLEIYPGYEELGKVRYKYAEALAGQQKSQNLEDAETMAEAGDYPEAINLMSTLLSVGEDEDYRAAYDEYCAAYKQTMLESAATLAEGKNYLDAIAKLDGAIRILDEDEELLGKIAEYEQAYITDTIASANALTKKKEYDNALSLLNEALKSFPDNEQLTQAVASTEKAKESPDSSSTSSNPNQDPVQPKDSEEHDVTGTHSKDKAVTVQREDVYHSAFSDAEVNGECEWFCFTTSVNYSGYGFKLLNNSVDSTVYLTVYDPYDKELGTASAGKGNTGNLYLSLEANTKYWIKVSRYYSDRTGNYQFEIFEKICDAGHNKSTAFYVDLDTENTKALDLHGYDDWYRFTTTENYSTYKFKLTNNSIDCTLYLTVYDEYDTELGTTSIGKGKSSSMDLELAAGKEYTIKLSRYYGDRTGYYQFTVCEMVCDGGLTQEDAFPLKVNETFQGTADTTFTEWYVYTFTEDKEYTLQLTNNSIDTTTYATVYDVLGTELGTLSANKGKTSESTLAITKGTVLYVKITRYYSDRFGNYSLKVT